MNHVTLATFRRLLFVGADMSGTPTVARLALMQMLVRLREKAGLDHTTVGLELDVSAETVRRWERGKHSIKKPMVRELARLYEATPGQTAKLTALAQQAKERGAVERYPGGAPPEFRMFVDFEPMATRIWSYEPEYIPGLIQTPDYLTAVQDAQLDDLAPQPQAVQQLRASRHAMMFDRDDMPEMRFVVGLAAMGYVERLPASIRDGQIERLREVDRMPTASVRVVTRLHSGMNGGFTLLSPAEGVAGANRFAYIEAQDVCRYVETSDVVSLYDKIFRSVWDRAESLEEYLS